MKGYKRHTLFYKVVRIAMMPYLRWRFGFRFQKSKRLESPTLILSNHNTDWDPFLVSQSFHEHMYFVASEHIFRWGFLSTIILYLVAPISRAKATNDTRTVMQVLRTLRAGANVCIFAEGNRSFNGETSEILTSTGKLAKQSGAALVTYRLTGGYFTEPRWGSTIRRGITGGFPVNSYSPEVLATMTEEEINVAIRQDLYINAYEAQGQQPIPYKGKRLAEHLETVLYLCPSCGRMSTIQSSGDCISCSCGLSLRFTPFGFLESTTSDPSPFKTILEWDRWQVSSLKQQQQSLRELSMDLPITTDEEQSLYLIQKREAAHPVGVGRLSLFSDRLVFHPNNSQPQSFPFENITAMAVHGQMDLVFSTADGLYFEIESLKPRSATKYMELYRILTEKAS
jgi:1-acyl-sn-glycerol-3-phosphate acyltransferase